MAECFVHGNLNGNGAVPKITGTAPYTLTDEGNGNWNLQVTGDGTIEFSSLGTGKNGVEVFMVAGGAAGAENGGYGGGGYTAQFIAYPGKGIAYPVAVGAGATASGASGGSTSIFGNEVTSGTGGGVEVLYQDCVVHSVNGTAGNVYYYSSKSASAASIGDGYRNVSLAYPLITTTVNTGYTVYVGYPKGYYRCIIDSAYPAGSPKNGTGSEAVYPFGDTNYAMVGGSIGSQTEDAVLFGQGGGNNGSVAFGKGMKGMIFIRNRR